MDLLLRLAKPLAIVNAESREACRADISALLAKLPR